VKKLIAVAAAIAAVGFIGSASAADMPLKAVGAPLDPGYNWTGWYVGANAGAHMSRDNDSATDSSDANFIPGNIVLLNQAAPFNLTQSGFAGGGHIGYNWQSSNFVYGLEADFDALTGTVTRNLIQPIIVDTVQFTDSAKDNWMSTARARAGFAFNQFLIFGTAGLAVSNWQLNHTFAQIAGGGTTNGATSQTVTRAGWAVGGGVEYALINNWSIRGEYLHADFRTVSSSLTSTQGGAFPTVFSHSEKLTEDVVRGGISYKFSSR
jgi:outer membrane immunogenic protein